jgi:hypothetical protein
LRRLLLLLLLLLLPPLLLLLLLLLLTDFFPILSVYHCMLLPLNRSWLAPPPAS